MTLDFAQLKEMTSPGVYVLRAGSVVLYVGATEQGLVRPLAAQHKIAPYLLQPDATLTFEPCDDPFAREDELIRELQPAMNSSKNEYARRRKAKSRYHNRRRVFPPLLTVAEVERIRSGKPWYEN